jgi:hypothetical protein
MPIIPRLPAAPSAQRKYPIFVSYRRSDAGGWTLYLVERLEERFGEGVIFYDKDSIQSGEVFTDKIDHAVRDCSVVLAVIADDWLHVEDDQGKRRLEKGDDVVAREISLALELGRPVIPVLCEVTDKNVPLAANLPPKLGGLATRDYFYWRGKRIEYRLQLDQLAVRLTQHPGVPTPLPATTRDGRSVSVVPEKLPYLCDRSEQEDAVRDALRRHMEERPARPIALVIHGRSNESHNAFVDRLEELLLPRLLGTRVSGLVKFLHLKKALSFGGSPSDSARELRDRITDELQIANVERDGDLCQRLSQLRPAGIAPVIKLRSEECRDPAVALRRLAEYWSAFPDTPERCLVACVICAIYQAGDERPFWRRWLSGGDESLRNALTAGAGALRGDPRLTWIVLPELQSVRFSHVEDWAAGDDVRGAMKRELTRKALRAAYGADEPLPMEDVIDRMRSLLIEPQGT